MQFLKTPEYHNFIQQYLTWSIFFLINCNFILKEHGELFLIIRFRNLVIDS